MFTSAVLSIAGITTYGACVGDLSDGISIKSEPLFQDRVGNTYGIGTKLVVRYGADREERHMREIQASGGFLSFDSAGAFFGLGESAEVQEIEIEWSTGDRSVVAGPFAAGQVHTIQRSEQ